MSSTTARGFALVAALFLLVVASALGLFAMRLGAHQEQTASLQLGERRALAAAHAGLEYWSNRAFGNPSLPCGAPVSLNLQAYAPNAGFDGYQVTVSCVRIASGPQAVYEVTADAWSGTFGNPDFVRRSLTRRIGNIGAGTWGE